MRKNRGDSVAVGALDVHEERVGRLNQALLLMLAGLFFLGRMEQIVVLQRERNCMRNTERVREKTASRQRRAVSYASTHLRARETPREGTTEERREGKKKKSGKKPQTKHSPP